MPATHYDYVIVGAGAAGEDQGWDVGGGDRGVEGAKGFRRGVADQGDLGRAVDGLVGGVQ